MIEKAKMNNSNMRTNRVYDLFSLSSSSKLAPLIIATPLVGRLIFLNRNCFIILPMVHFLIFTFWKGWIFCFRVECFVFFSFPLCTGETGKNRRNKFTCSKFYLLPKFFVFCIKQKISIKKKRLSFWSFILNVRILHHEVL